MVDLKCQPERKGRKPVDTFVAVVFDDEAHAFKGAEALQALHQSGDVIVYSAAVIAKDSDAKLR